MKARLKEPVDYVQFTGAHSIGDIEELFDKYGYDTVFNITRADPSVTVNYKYHESPIFRDQDVLLLDRGDYLIFHDLLINKLSNGRDKTFRQLSKIEFISLFWEENHE